MDLPETRHVTFGDAALAYQVVGEGEVDLTGASDAVALNAIPSWEEWTEDPLVLAGGRNVARVVRQGAGRKRPPRVTDSPESVDPWGVDAWLDGRGDTYRRTGCYGASRMFQFDLVIFDCDGVLVDSERLAVRTETEILATLGWPLTQAEVVERFVGRSAEYMHEQIEEHLGRPIDWERDFESRYQEVFEQELRPVEGIVDALKAIGRPTCVASSGTHAKIRFSLGLTGLLDYFGDRIFSVQDVSRGKPAPDLFLHAAERMGVSPDACAVVEDSPSGIEAALAAGMHAFAFSGGVVGPEHHQRTGIVVFDDMRLLPGLLFQASLGD